MRKESARHLQTIASSSVRLRWPMNLVSRLDFTTLKLFVAIVERQSFTKAAEHEAIAPSAVSKRIADLEDSMQIKLLNRQTKLPTAAGAVLLHYARSILGDIAKLEEEIVEHGSGARGLVRIVTSESALIRYVPCVLSSFSERQPNIRIDLRTEVSPIVIKSVLNGTADLGIFLGSSFVEGVDVVPCGSDRLVVVTAVNHPAARLARARLLDLQDYEFVEQEANSVIQRFVEQAANELGRTIRTRARVVGYDAACSMALAGFGLAIVPDSFVAKYAASIKMAVIQLDEPWAERRYKLCTRSGGHVSMSTRLVLEYFKMRLESDATDYQVQPVAHLQGHAKALGS
jgi:DNA-binding transcriptional LysR family regulator